MALFMHLISWIITIYWQSAWVVTQILVATLWQMFFETDKDRLVQWAFFLLPYEQTSENHFMLAWIVCLLACTGSSTWWITRLQSMTWKTFLVTGESLIVNSTSPAHVLPSSFIQQVLYYAAPWVWNCLVDSIFFLFRVQTPKMSPFHGPNIE